MKEKSVLFSLLLLKTRRLLKDDHDACKAVVHLLHGEPAPADRRIVDIGIFAFHALPDDKVIKIPVDDAGRLALHELL